MKEWKIRQQIANEEVDYVQLKDILSKYAQPRDKITSLLKNKVLIRIKKGLYIFGPNYSQKPYVKETLANLIYGPSAISLEYALSFYGLIPEKVNTITSITNKRNKVFNTPAGCFTYQYLHPEKYSIGITQIQINKTHPVLIATPEKALADLLTIGSQKQKCANKQELETLLFENLRIESENIKKMQKNLIYAIAKIYKKHNTDLLAKYISLLS